MNPTRSFMRGRAAAIVAQLTDKQEPGLDVNHRVELRVEYTDLRAAMSAVSGFKVVTACQPLLAESLWGEHCEALGLDIDHTAADL